MQFKKSALRGLYSFGVGLTALAVFPAIALADDGQVAQSETINSGPDGQKDGAIIVTAQRREQAIVDVPLSISALGAEALRDFNIQGHSDLAYYTPGLIVQEQSPQRTGYVMRGITAEVTDAFSEPQISIYTDGVDNSRQSGSVLEFVDIERVEVVKGPQGTLFGRGAAIGAISVRSARPNLTQAFGEASLEYGNYDYKNLTFMANAPLIDDKLGVRAAFRLKKRDGFVDNLAGPIDTLYGRDTQFGRIAFRYEPNARWTTDLIFQGQKDDGGPIQFKNINIAPAGGDVSPFTPTAQDRPDQALSRNVYSVVLDSSFQFSDSWSLQSVTGYREIDALERWDGDGTAFSYIIGNQDTQQWQLSQEVRAAWQPDGPVSAFVGASVFHEEINDALGLGLNEQYLLNGGRLTAAPVTVFPVAPGVFLPVSEMNLSTRFQNNVRDSYAIFADASWRVTDKLTIEAGLRYQKDEGESEAATTVVALDGRSLIALRNGVLGGNSRGVFYKQSGGFELLTPRFVAQYKINDDLNVYAGAARGARSGAVGVAITSAGVGARDIVKPEYVMNYEVGLKAKIHGMVADAAIYHYDYTDFITIDPNPAIGRINAGEAKATGFEASLNGEVVRGLRLSAAYAYHDGQYENFRTSAGDLSGNRLRLSPENTFTLGVNYERPIAAGFKLRAQGTYAYRGQHFFNDDNLNTEQQKAYSIVNGAIGVSSPNDKWYAEVWGNNIFDEEYVIDIGNTGKSFGQPTAIPGEPRFYGVRLGYHF